jgi:Tfp pilus assembly protein PilN
MNHINLLKPRLVPCRQDIRSRLSHTCVIALTSLVVTLIGWQLYLKNEIKVAQSIESKLLAEKQELERLQRAIDENQKDLHRVDQTFHMVEMLQMNRSTAIQIIDTVARSQPQLQLALDRLVLSEESLKLSGIAIKPSAIVTFTTALRSSGLFDSVQLSLWEKGQEAIRFEILGPLKE